MITEKIVPLDLQVMPTAPSKMPLRIAIVVYIIALMAFISFAVINLNPSKQGDQQENEITTVK